MNENKIIKTIGIGSTACNIINEILPPDEAKGQIPFDTPIPNYMKLLEVKE